MRSLTPPQRTAAKDACFVAVGFVGAAAAAPAVKKPTATKQASLAAVRWGGVRERIMFFPAFRLSLAFYPALTCTCTLRNSKPWVIRGRSFVLGYLSSQQ